MRILNKRNFVDCVWFLFIAIAIPALDGFSASDHFISLGGMDLVAHGWEGIFSVLFLLQYFVATCLLYIATRIHSGPGFLVLAVLWVLMVIDLSFADVVGRQATMVNIALLNSVLWNVSDLVSQYIVSIVVQCALTAVLFIPLLRRLMKSQRPARKFRLFLWPLIVMFLMYAGMFMARGEAGVAAYPKGFAYGFGTISLQINRAFKGMQTADPFEVRKISDAVVDKIIVVVDNGVTYDEFVATGANTLPYVVDYGNAFSAANCTASANFVLRRGGWVRNGTGEIIVRGIDHLFSLALKADYKTAYQDNANVLDDPFTRHYFDDSEIAAIQYRQAGENALYLRDLASVGLIPGLLERKKIFVLVNKVGAHFPYANSLPPNAASGRKMYNYKKTLALNTRGYLEKLIDVIDDGTVVFYTSDHGQNFNGRIPYCNTGKEIRRTEYTVPFLVITKNTGVQKLLKARQSVYADKLTHLEFSESVRNMMGFAVDDIDSIFKPPRRLQNIYCGLYGPPYAVMDVKPQCRGLR